MIYRFKIYKKMIYDDIKKLTKQDREEIFEFAMKRSREILTGTMEGNMTNRPTFEQIYMEFAENISRRSTCERLHVGAVITTTDFRKVIGLGYNGNATGFKNSCDRPEESGNCGCLHAEDNAVINCNVDRDTKKIFFVTHLPCPTCAKRIINLGNVVKVIFKNDYRRKDSIFMFNKIGIEVYQIDNDGNMTVRFNN